MDDSILNIEQATEFLGVSEKTLIKLLRDEHIPARKIGREWRISKDALVKWISTGDSYDYINKNDFYQFSKDEDGNTDKILNSICKKIDTLRKNSKIKSVLAIKKDIGIPITGAKLRISYKQKRDVEKLEFKIYWPLSDGDRINSEKGEL